MRSPASHSPDATSQEPLLASETQPPVSFKRSFQFFVLFLLISLVIFAVLFFSSLPQVLLPTPSSKHTVQIDDDSSVVLSGKQASSPQIPSGQFMLLEGQKGLSLLTTKDAHISFLSTPGYIYNLSVRPLLLSSGILIYSGDGIWQTNIFHPHAKQIAFLPVNQVLTSLVVSNDDLNMAWSTAPVEGSGPVHIYAGPLEHTVQVYEQASPQCPCFRVFSFFQSAWVESQPVLLLSDDLGDHNPTYYGLWLLDLNRLPSVQPLLLLSGRPSQGPLMLLPNGKSLLYSPEKGFVPAPTDKSVPDVLASQSYANSLSLITIASSDSHEVSAEQELLTSQHVRSNSAEYHWVTTPTISPDGHTLVYVLFSSDATQSYARHNALYLSTFADTSKPSASKPELLASSSADFMELGPWLDNHLLSFYADGGIYLLDTQTNGLAKISAVSGEYTRIIGVVK